MTKESVSKELTKPKYKKGEIVQSINKHKGTIFNVYFNDASKEWVYLIAEKGGKPIAAIRESNIKNA